jgi:hypothetical protein
MVEFEGVLADVRRKCDHASIRKVNREALLTLRVLRRADAEVFAITSHSGRRIQDVIRSLEREGILDSSFLVRPEKCRTPDGMMTIPKDHSRLVENIGEDNPLRNCAIIGADPNRDVPVRPFGIVTAIAGMPVSFGKAIAYMRVLLEVGAGSFARGFDMVSSQLRNIRKNAVQFIDDGRWNFNDDVRGLSRVLYFRY